MDRWYRSCHPADDVRVGVTVKLTETPLTEPVHDYDSLYGALFSDSVKHPKHYNTGRIEVIDAIEDWRLGFNLGNVVKYVARADHKGKRLEDLKKALWYLQREIDKNSPL